MDVATEIAEFFFYLGTTTLFLFFFFMTEFSHNADMRDAEIKEIE